MHPAPPAPTRRLAPRLGLLVGLAACALGHFSACVIGGDGDAGGETESCELLVETDGAIAPTTLRLRETCTGVVPDDEPTHLVLNWEDAESAWTASLRFEDVSLGLKVEARRATVTLRRASDGATFRSVVPCSGDLDRNVLDEVTSDAEIYRLEGEVFCTGVPLDRDDLDDGSSITVAALRFVGRASAPTE